MYNHARDLLNLLDYGHLFHAEGSEAAENFNRELYANNIKNFNEYQLAKSIRALNES